MPDLYAVLGVDRTADERTVKDAYRRLARRHHPDAGGDQDRMMVLNKAWSVLGDPEKRAAYDAKRAHRERPKPKAPRARDGETVLDFGRYEGWTLQAIAAHDDDYLEWLRRTQTGRALRAQIDEALAGRTAVLEAIRPAAPAPARRRRWGRG